MCVCVRRVCVRIHIPTMVAHIAFSSEQFHFLIINTRPILPSTLPARNRRYFTGKVKGPNCNQFVISQPVPCSSSANINIGKIEQLFSTKYAARTHLFSFGGGKIISVHDTISRKVEGHGKQSLLYIYILIYDTVTEADPTKKNPCIFCVV